MTNIRIAVVASALLLSAGLAACGDNNDDDTPTTGPTTVVTTPTGTPKVSVSASRQAAAEKAADLPPAPKAADTQAYVSRLREVDEDLVTGASSELLVARGRDQCHTIYTTTDQDTVIDAVNLRFTTVKHPDGFGDAKAKMINDAVKKFICPKAWS